MKKLYTSKKNPYYPLFKKSFETGIIFVMAGSRRVLVKLVLFRIRSTKASLEPFLAKFSQFQNLFQTMGNRAFFWGIQLSPTSICIKMASLWSLKSKKLHEKGAFYYINQYMSNIFSDFKLWWLAISTPVKVGKSYIPQKKAL